MPKPDHHSKARNLRKKQTPAEQLLWSKLRSRGLSGCKFRRQHIIEHYILDFYCYEAHLAIEVDGGQHADQESVVKDNQRTVFLNQQGIKLIRFWNHEVLENLDEVLTEIDTTISEIMRKKVGH